MSQRMEGVGRGKSRTGSEEGARQFREDVFPAEMKRIIARRAALGLEDPSEKSPTIEPSVRNDLVGLALSGGGIRSATFSLGVIQALNRFGVLRRVDYLSTVSGGGFIGSCVSSLLNDQGARPEGARFPLHATLDGGEESEGGAGSAEPEAPARAETAAVTHLRNTSKYLAPGGLLDTFRIPTLALRGILINLFVLLPYIMIAVILTELLYAYEDVSVWLIKAGPMLTLGLFLALVLLYPIVARAFRGSGGWSGRNVYGRVLTWLLFLALLTLLAVPLLMLVDYAVRHSPADIQESVVFAVRNPLHGDVYWQWLLVFAVVGVLLFTARAARTVSKWGGKLFFYLIGLLGPLVVFGIYLALCLVQIESPYLHLGLWPAMERSALEGRVTDELADALRAKDIVFEGDAEVTTRVEGESWVLSGKGVRHGAPLTVTIKRRAEGLRLSRSDIWDREIDRPFFIVGVILLLVHWFFVDVNATSAHSFYRDRLSRAYLIGLGGKEGLRFNDRQRLSELNRDGTCGPYHLINVTLNLQSSRDPNLRGRKSDFFVFSKHYTGSERTGFVETGKLERTDGHVDLGTAMAVSGAAAAPNMGVTTVRALVFIMTLLNLRLGYWLPNPSYVGRGSLLRRMRLRLGAGPWFLLREAFSRMDADGTFVNISDGGHIENLALYELLRRRCRFIVAADGEADPEMRFGGLIKLLRYARIDMGIDIDIDLAPLRRGPSGFSERHWAVGTIHYPGEAEPGYLVYVKSSMTGNESNDVRDYHERNPSFPHESTADQFFDENQFESYRALGYHIGSEIFAGHEDLEALVHKAITSSDEAT